MVTKEPSIGTKKNETYQVRSVDRALMILTCFKLTKPELTLIEICEMTGLPKPTVFRLLSSLEAAQFIERASDQEKYRIGIRLFELGNVYLSNLSIERIVYPYMQKITQKHNMACNLAILDNGQVVYIASTNSAGPLQYVSIIGYRHYVHCSALGKALVIDLPDDEIKAILSQWGMPTLSPKSITDPKTFLENIKVARENHFTIDDQEGAIGIYCMAVSIRNRSGRVLAAFSISGPSPQFTEKIKYTVIQDLLDGAAEISNQL